MNIYCLNVFRFDDGQEVDWKCADVDFYNDVDVLHAFSNLRNGLKDNPNDSIQNW